MELEQLGRTFRTNGDTEVLAQALDQWGLDALPRLEGMFAFAWSSGDRHVLVRDRYGKIPLYVARAKGRGFVWSSERKAMDRAWQAIASDGYKACLSGEAADELFGGYGSMQIKGSKATDREWRAIRLQQLAKMARGNFIRCNKVFMAAGVECRLPFMERPLVETVLAMTKADCPPGKKALKQAARDLVPPWVISRPKDTFQGGAGMIDAAASVIPDPRAYYASECRTLYGSRAED